MGPVVSGHVPSLRPICNNLRWRNALNHKLEVGERRFLASYSTLTTWRTPVKLIEIIKAYTTNQLANIVYRLRCKKTCTDSIDVGVKPRQYSLHSPGQLCITLTQAPTAPLRLHARPMIAVTHGWFIAPPCVPVGLPVLAVSRGCAQ